MFKFIGMACLIATVSASPGFAKRGGGKVAAAPEIDPSSAVAALTLLAGGVAVMLGRRSKRLQTQAE